MEVYWGRGGIAPLILDPSIGWRGMVSFTPRERVLGTHWIGGSVSPRAGLDAVVKSFQFLLGLKPPIIQPVAQRYTAELSRSRFFHYKPYVTNTRILNTIILISYLHTGHSYIS
jgi:hypothetical protein